jgi:hypothetical protein
MKASMSTTFEKGTAMNTHAMHNYIMEQLGFTPDESWHVAMAMNGLAVELRYPAGAIALSNEVRGSAQDGLASQFNGCLWSRTTALNAASKIEKLDDWKANAVWFFVAGFWAGTRVYDR